MEGLAPPLKLVLYLRMGIERGDSIKATLQKYFFKENDEYARLVATWLVTREQGKSIQNIIDKEKSPFRKGLVLLLERGLRGESIHQNLLHIEEEIIEACQNELDAYLSTLPIKLLVPLLLFQFPAFLVLLFGPLLFEFLQQMS